MRSRGKGIVEGPITPSEQRVLRYFKRRITEGIAFGALVAVIVMALSLVLF